MYDHNQFTNALNSLNGKKQAIRESKIGKKIIKENEEETVDTGWVPDDYYAEVKLMKNPELAANVPEGYAEREILAKLSKIGKYGPSGEKRGNVTFGEIAKFLIATFGAPSLDEIRRSFLPYYDDEDGIEESLAEIVKGAKAIGITLT